jgi:hypothetical protein
MNPLIAEWDHQLDERVLGYMLHAVQQKFRQILVQNGMIRISRIFLPFFDEFLYKCCNASIADLGSS